MDFLFFTNQKIMKKHTFLIIGILIFTRFLSIANELVIEVTTDKYPSETSWTLYDTGRNIIKESETLEKNTTYRDTLQLDASLCYFWTIYDSYGNGMSNGVPPGDFKICIDGNLVSQLADPNFGDSISVYGLGSNCSAYDVSVEKLTFNDVQAFNAFDFTFDLLNFGSEVISSLEVSYTIDGTESEIFVLDNLSIEFGQLVALMLPEQVQFATASKYTLGIEVLKINDHDDGYTNNNKLSKDVYVNEGYWKKPMHEVFTSSTCPPCNYGNEVIDGTLAKYDSNQYSLVKYQANYPAPGDPYYTAEVGRMMQIYPIGGVPSLFVNLNSYYPHEYTNEYLDPLLEQLSDFGVELTAQVIGDSVFVNSKIISTITSAEEVYVRISVVEKTTYENVASNGEKEFHNVFMKFLTKWDGDNIGQMYKGSEIEISYAESLAETHIEEMDDLRVVIYLFYDTNYTILQSDMMDIPFTPAAPAISFNIEDGERDVDTLTSIVISSSKALYNLDGSALTEFSSIVVFKNSENNEDVAFNADISNDNKVITLLPKNYLNANSIYRVALKDVQSDEEIKIEESAITFSTISLTDIDNKGEKKLSIYPNPVSNILTISSQTPIRVQITDLSGRIVSQFNANALDYAIDMSGFDNGIYLVKVEMDNNTELIKIIKE